MNHENDFNKAINFGMLVNEFINLNRHNTDGLIYLPLRSAFLYETDNCTYDELSKFDYIEGEKFKLHNMYIRNAWDALCICALLVQPDAIDYNCIPRHLRYIFETFRDDFPYHGTDIEYYYHENLDNTHNIIERHKHIYLYKDILLPWITEKNGETMKNPNTGRNIIIGKRSYRMLFGNIKLVENRDD